MQRTQADIEIRKDAEEVFQLVLLVRRWYEWHWDWSWVGLLFDQGHIPHVSIPWTRERRLRSGLRRLRDLLE